MIPLHKSLDSSLSHLEPVGGQVRGPRGSGPRLARELARLRAAQPAGLHQQPPGEPRLHRRPLCGA